MKPWTRPAQTKEELDWAPSQIIDLSTFDEPGGKEKLAAELADSVKNGEYDICLYLQGKNWLEVLVGFWMVTGTDIEDSETLRQLSIGAYFLHWKLDGT